MAMNPRYCMSLPELVWSLLRLQYIPHHAFFCITLRCQQISNHHPLFYHLAYWQQTGLVMEKDGSEI